MIESDTNEAASHLVGSVLSERFELLELVGSGGAGSVYRARDRILSGRAVAVKVLHQQFDISDNIAQRFFREVELMHEVNHPNVVRTFDVGQDKGIFYFSMEFLEGKSLQDAIDDGSSIRLDLDSLILQIVEGLSAIHECGIIHRDLKPGNILLLPDDRIKITDFGIARGKNSRVTRDNQLLGSMGYMAPEAWSGKSITASVDLYSLGVILYEVVTGRLPFDRDEMAHLMFHHLNTVPEPVSVFCPEIDQWVVSLVNDLLKKKPEERPKSAESVKDYLPSCQKSPSQQGESDLLASLRPGYSQSNDIAIPSSSGTAFDSLIFVDSDNSKPKQKSPLLRQEERLIFNTNEDEVKDYTEADYLHSKSKRGKVIFLSATVLLGIAALVVLFFQMRTNSAPLQTYKQVTVVEDTARNVLPSTHVVDAAHERHLSQLQRIKSIILSLKQPSVLSVSEADSSSSYQRFKGSTKGRGEVNRLLESSQLLIDEFAYFYPFSLRDLGSIASYKKTPALQNGIVAKETYRREILDLEFILRLQSYRTGDLLMQGESRLTKLIRDLKSAKQRVSDIRRSLIEEFGTWETRLYGAARGGLKSIAVPLSQEHRDIRVVLDSYTKASNNYNQIVAKGLPSSSEGKSALKKAQRSMQMKLNSLERKIFQIAEERYVEHVLSLANLLVLDDLLTKHIKIRSNHAEQLQSFADAPLFLKDEDKDAIRQKLKNSKARLREDVKMLGNKKETWIRVEIASSKIRDLLGR
jgi:serine/threonine protein kinase